MAETETRDTSWIGIQQRTFTRWVNQYLVNKMLKVENLATDLEDGIKLISLLEEISGKPFPAYNKKPRIRAQKLENTSFALNFLKSEGIKLVAIGPEDIVDHQLKLILGLIWTIILRYQIQKGDGNSSAKNELLEWVRRQIPECNIKNFTDSWSDGKAICHLTDSLKRGCINLDEVDRNPDALANATLGEDVAERELEIPKVLLPEDMVSDKPDELSVMTYISYFRDYEANLAKRRAREELERIAVPEKCLAHGAGLQGGEQFIPAEFTIQAKNQFGTNVPCGGDKFDVHIKSPAAKTADSVPHHTTDNNDGTYTVKYVPLDAGRHTITIQLKGKGIQGSPYHVPIDKTSVAAHGSGLEKGVQFEVAEFEINAKKLHEHGVAPQTSDFDIHIQAPGSQLQPIVSDSEAGTYIVRYTPVDVGRHVITISLKKRPIANGPFSVNIEKTPIYASGKGLETGEQFLPAHFTIDARPLAKSGFGKGVSDFEVKITGPKGHVDADIKDNNDGTFAVTYLPTQVGRHNIAINAKGQPISNGPFNVPIERTSLGATGAGLDSGEQFIPSSFVLNTKPLIDSGVPVEDDDVKVHVHGPKGDLPVTLTRNPDGNYNVGFTPVDIGKHNITVSVKDQPIVNSNAMVNKTSCNASGPGLEGGEQFIPAHFDINTSPLSKAGVPVNDSDMEVKINGPHGPVHADVSKESDAQFKVHYTPNDVGKHNVIVTLKGTEITNQGVPVSKTGITASGPGLEKGPQYLPLSFFIDASKQIAAGARFTPADFTTKVNNATGVAVDATTTENEPGHYTVTYVPVETGRYSVQTAVRGTNIASASVPISKTDCFAKGPGLEKGTQFLPAHFTIEAFDLHKSGFGKGVEDFDVKIGGPKGTVEAKVEDKKDGTFAVSYVPTEPGRHNIAITLKGQPISNGPFSIPIEKTGLAATGVGLESGEQFIPSNFDVNAKSLIDAGVPVEESDLVVTITGPKGSVDSTVKKNPDGNFSVTYIPNDIGRHNVQVVLKDTPLTNTAVPVQKTTCNTFGPGLEKGEQLVPAAFTVNTKRLHDAGVPAQLSDVSVKINGPKGPVEATLTPNADGTFGVVYKPADIGRYNVLVNLKGTDIANVHVPIGKTGCSAFGTGLEKGEQFIPSQFQVDAKSLKEHGESVAPSDLDIKISGPQGAPLEHVVTDKGDGTFDVLFTPKEIGRHNVVVAVKQQPISNQAVPVQKTSCSANGPGLEKAEQFVPAFFFVDSTPLANAGVPITADEVGVKVVGPNGDLPVTITKDPETEGIFKVTYIPKDIASHRITVAVKGQEIANKPYVAVSKTSCTSYGPGLENGIQFVPTSFTVDTKILHANGVPASLSDVDVKVTGPQGPLLPSIEPVEDGTFVVGYTPNDHGRHTIAVTLKGQPITNTAVSIVKTTATASGPGLEKTEQFLPAVFNVDATALHKANVPVALDDINVKVVSPKGDLVPVVEPESDGIFRVTYIPTEIATHKVTVNLRHQEIVNKPYVSVFKTTAKSYGPGLESGVQFLPSVFTIDTKILHTHGVPASDSDIAVAITGPQGPVSSTLTVHDDGTFTASYIPNDPGRVQITVALKGTQITNQGVPIQKTGITVSGPGLDRGEQYIPTSYDINAKDLKDKGVAPAPEEFNILVEAPSGAHVPVEVKDNDDGTYTVNFTPVEPGRHKVATGLKNKPIANNFLSVDKSTTDATKCTASGPGLEPGNVIEKSTHFTIQARNKIGDPMKTGGEVFKVHISAPHGSEVESTIKDNQDGTYYVEYEPLLPGLHVVSVSLKNIAISGSPWEVTIERPADGPDPSQFEVYGPGIEGGDTADPCIFTIQAKNSAGEPIRTGGHRVAVEVFGPKGVEVPVTLVDNNDGTYTATYQPVDHGPHQVDAMLRTKLPLYYDHIASSPYIVNIIPGTDPNASVVYGSGIEEAYDTRPAEFHIKARDRDGNDMKRGGDPFKVNVTGPSGPIPANVVDKGDGTYDVTYEPTEPGNHKVEVTLRGKPVAKSPYTVSVKEGASAEFTFVEGFSFVIRSRTKSDDDKPSGGEKFEVTIDGPTTVEAKVDDKNNGTYVTSYKLDAPGEYNIGVQINNHHIRGSPWKQVKND